MLHTFDIIVLGLGAAGSAALYQLAQRGVHVLGVDQFAPPHAMGSTHGDTRLTRLAIGEGAHYVPFVRRSQKLWRTIEEETDTELLTVTGGLIIGQPTGGMTLHGSDFFSATVAVAQQHQIRHDLLDADGIRRRFPQFNVYDEERGYYEYDAGFLRPEACVTAQLGLAQKYGATIHTNERVLSFTSNTDGVQVTTDRGAYAAAQLVITAGPWLPQLLMPDAARLFTARRQVMFWFDVAASIESFLPMHCPVYIWEGRTGQPPMYGFPAVDGPHGGVKVASEQFETTTTPETINRTVSALEQQTMYAQHVAPYLPGLSQRCLRAVTCLYTLTPDFGFIVDRHPQHTNVVIVSPCSGHGFKHSAALGESVAELVTTNRTTLDISPFRLGRF